MLKPFFLLLCILGLFNYCMASDTASVQVLFRFNEHSLTPDAKLQLDEVVPNSASTKLLGIKLYGYTDQVGSEGYNRKLSMKRATAVRDYLLERGIEPAIITIVEGRGESNPVVDRMDSASRQQNRRVTVMIEYEAQVEEGVVIPVSKKRPLGSDSVATGPVTLTDKLKDSSMKVGNKFILNNINFEGGRHRFLAQAYTALDELLNAMKSIPSLNIEIQGHICCEIGDIDGVDMDLGTRDLSVQRARAVYLYLYRNGIDVGRMSYKGFGHRFPLTKEETEEEKTANRRVEIRIVSK